MTTADRANVICFASAKGGSGKTVTSTAVGLVLSGLGKRVLLMDLDAATNGMTLLFLKSSSQTFTNAVVNARSEIDKEGKAYGIYEAADSLHNSLIKVSDEIYNGIITASESEEILDSLRTRFQITDELSSADLIDSVEKARIGQLLIESPTPFNVSENLDFLPASFVTMKTEDVDPKMLGWTLQRALGAFRQNYDYILIDAQAGADLFALEAVALADNIVLVTEYDYISSLGVARMEQLFPVHFEVERTWKLFNKVLPEFTSGLGRILSIARYLSPIHWDRDVVLGFADGEIAINMDTPNEYTLAVVEMIQSLLKQEIASVIDEWKSSRDESSRGPARDQLNNVSENLVNAQEHLQYLRSTSARFQVGLGTLGLGLISLIAAPYLLGLFKNFVFVYGLVLSASILVVGIFYTFAGLRETSMRKAEAIRQELVVADLAARRESLRVRAESSILERLN